MHAVETMSLEGIKYNGQKLHILNQLLLPFQSVYEEISGYQNAWETIRSMKVNLNNPSRVYHYCG